MKIVCKDKTIDLSKFETVRYRVSLLGSSSGYPVEAIRHETNGGIFGGAITVEEEIARFVYEEGARELTKAITEEWIAGANTFFVEEWKRKFVEEWKRKPKKKEEKTELEGIDVSLERINEKLEKIKSCFGEGTDEMSNKKNTCCHCKHSEGIEGRNSMRGCNIDKKLHDMDDSCMCFEAF